MNKAYLLTGGNTGDRIYHLKKAVEELESAAGPVFKQSALYETAAWGKTDQQPFLNQALLLNTPLSADNLMRTILQIEEKLGRKRAEKYGPRTIDIDILFFNQEIHDTVLIRIPHPELAGRRFALKPLAEIAARFVHPVLEKTVATLLKECKDSLPVKKLG